MTYSLWKSETAVLSFSRSLIIVQNCICSYLIFYHSANRSKCIFVDAYIWRLSCLGVAWVSLSLGVQMQLRQKTKRKELLKLHLYMSSFTNWRKFKDILLEVNNFWSPKFLYSSKENGVWTEYQERLGKGKLSETLVLPEAELISITRNCVVFFVRCTKSESSEYLPMLVLCVLCISSFYTVHLACLNIFELIIKLT